MSFINYKDIKKVRFDEKQYLKTGITKLDKMIVGIGRGQYTLIFGTRGCGKTTFTNMLTANFLNQDEKGLICNFEMPNHRTQYWLNLQIAGEHNLKSEITLSGKEIWLIKDDETENKIIEWVDKSLLVNDNETFDVYKVYKQIEATVAKHPEFTFVILDNLMKLNLDEVDENKYEAQSRLVKGLQKLCQDKNIALILVAHPNKIKTLPRIEDNGGSGDIINTADNVLILHRVNEDFKIRAKEYFVTTEVNKLSEFDNLIEVAKNRDFGEEGFCGVFFEPKAKRFTNNNIGVRYYKWEEPPKYKYPKPKEIEKDDDFPF